MQAAPSLSDSRQAGPVVMDGLGDFDSPLDLQAEKAVEAKREAAYLLPVMWEGQAIKPWSLLRHAMHRRLIQHLAPVPPNLWGSDVDAHAADALLFLWLAHHEEQLILTLAGQPVLLWMQVFNWGEKAVPKEKWSAALELMLATFEQGKVTEVKVREEASAPGKPETPSR